MSSGDHFFEALADAVALRLERMASCNQRLLDVDQAARTSEWRPSLCAIRSAPKYLFVKIDSKLRFDRRDLDRYIDQAPRERV